MNSDVDPMGQRCAVPVPVSLACAPALTLALCLVLLSSGCSGGRTRAYSGVEQPAERIALLKHQTGFNQPSVYFIRVDGISISGRKYQYGEIELLPGRHEVEFGFEAAGLSLTYSFSTGSDTVIFEAEANRIYEARAVRLTNPWATAFSGGGRWVGVIVDLGTGATVGGAVVNRASGE